MKKVLLSLLIATMMATVAWAQEWERPRAWSGYETNRFWDNWEIAAGGGASMLQLSKNMNDEPGKFFDRVGWNANISATKWIVPVLGMRLRVDGGEFQNYSFDQPKYGKGIFKTPYLYVHGDILINMSNWIGGYKPDRIYSAVSYMGFGYTAMSWTDKSAGDYNGEYAFTSGLLNKFHITPQWDIELDLRTWIFRERSLPAEITSGNTYAISLSATVGVAYRFNQRDWTPGYSQVEVDGYIAAIMALEEGLVASDVALVEAAKEIEALEAKNKSLEADIARSKADKPKPCQGVKPECVAFFAIGDATISDYALATLETYVEQIRSNDMPITVVGYADKETGSAQRNEQLSKERAEGITAWLVKWGIDASRITTEWVGDTEVAFESPASPIVNRCVIIK